MGKIDFGRSYVDITPTSSETLSITLNGTLYDEAWDTNATTTVAAFVASHGAALQADQNVFVENVSGVLRVWGVSSASNLLTSADTGLVDGGLYAVVDVENLVAYTPSSATVVCSIASSNASYDTLTLTFISAAEALNGVKEIKRAVKYSKNSDIQFVKACKVAFS